MLRIGHAPLIVHRYSSGTPLQTALVELNELAGTTLGGRRVRVSLSALLAPPIAYSVPSEVKRWDERLAVARAASTDVLGVEADQLACQLSITHPGIATTVQTALIETLREWAKSNRGHVVSLRPLWSIATESRVALKRDVQGIILQEPDATTIVVPAQRKIGPTDVVRVFAGTPTASIHAAIDLLFKSLGISEPKIARLGFSEKVAASSKFVSKRWPSYWEVM